MHYSREIGMQDTESSERALDNGASKWSKTEIAVFAARMILAAVWIWSGVTKIGNKVETVQSIEGYEIFTTQWSMYLAEIIVPAEIAGGLLLILGAFPMFAGWTSALVLMLFVIGISQAWARGLVIDCGCFGDVQMTDDVVKNYAIAIVRDIVLIAMSFAVAYGPHRLALHNIGDSDGDGDDE